MVDISSRFAPIARPESLFIGGDWVAPSSSKRIDVISASTEELLVSVAEAQAEDIDRAVAAARDAFDHGPWPRMTHGERAARLHEVGLRVAERAGEFANVWSSEMGIVRSLSGMMVPGVADAFDYYGSLADSFPFEERHVPRAGGHVGLLVREPVGVVAAIVAWNGPLIMIAYKLAPALLAGCTVILKASPEAPGAAYLIAEIMAAAGIPRGVVNVVTADREVSELLVRHPGVDKVTFTGSSAAGKKIGAICAERVARCTLELGGKSAAVILDDYDVEAAARSIAGSARMMSGQVCSSLTRVVVTRHRHDELLEAMASSFSAITVGDPFDPATEMGPVATARHRDRVETHIARGRADGAMLAAGGARPRHLDRGFFVEPTVFGHVDNQMTIAREEIFGPVVCVIPADDEAQAIAIANDTPFGLNASVFTGDPDRAYAVARELRSGTVGQNSFRTDLSIAFGGFKQSGIGREGGTEGLMPYLETKVVILDAAPSHLKDAVHA